jgi:hypothetical protein
LRSVGAEDWYLIGGDDPEATLRELRERAWTLEGTILWQVHLGADLASSFAEMLRPMPLTWRRRTWRCRRRLRPLLVRPRSRELLDRLGLATGVLYVVRQP